MPLQNKHLGVVGPRRLRVGSQIANNVAEIDYDPKPRAWDPSGKTRSPGAVELPSGRAVPLSVPFQSITNCVSRDPQDSGRCAEIVLAMPHRRFDDLVFKFLQLRAI